MKVKNILYRKWKRTPVQMVRQVIKAMFLLFLLFTGLRFYQFYSHFETMGQQPFIPRPSAVEGFLPISALVAFKVWITSGEFDHIHPAGLVLFTFIVGSGIFFRKSFCSWICPIGTVSEWIGMLGKKVFKRNFEIPGWLAWLLTPLKYLLLLFFFTLILNMSADSAKFFLDGSYNKIADVKMLLFFLNMGGFALTVIAVLFILSLFFKNFWCRFLCPYGALIGLGSIFRMTKVRRNEETCTNCGMCTRVCPQRVKVSQKTQVLTPECTACLQCVEACPIKGTLNMTVANKKVSKWFIPVAFFSVFFVVVGIAKMTGHWNTVLTNQDWVQLISQVNQIGH